MRSLNILGLSLAAALAMPALALADTGLYVDGAVGQASVDDEGIDDNDTSLRLGVGWRFVEKWFEGLGATCLWSLNPTKAPAFLLNFLCRPPMLHQFTVESSRGNITL